MSKAAEFLEEFWKWRLEDSPELGTYSGEHQYDDRLDDVSIEAYQRRGKAAEQFLNRCRKILEVPNLDEIDRQNLSILADELELFLCGLPFQGYLFSVNYLEGIHLDIRWLISNSRFKDVADFNRYLMRLRALPKRIEQVGDNLRYAIKVGLTRHVSSMKGIREQFETYNKEPEETILYKPFKDASDDLDLSSQRMDAMLIIENEVKPAYEMLGRFICEEYMQHTRPSEGVSCLPNGKQYYEECLKWHLSFSISPAEVHEKGVEEMARIKALMLKVLKELGFEGDLRSFIKHLQSSKQFFFESKEAVLDGYNHLCQEVIHPTLSKLFYKVPKSKFKIELVSPTRLNDPSVYYFPGSEDGSRPGTFYINANDLSTCPTYEMVTQSLHEGEPGHHLQAMYTIEMEGVPAFRKHLEHVNYSVAPSRFPLYSAYAEGWGLYCEYLGAELGLYKDPYDFFGHLSLEMHRACRLVIDTGIHYFGWDFEKACQVLLENTALSEVAVKREVTRYILVPGQACSYKIGQMKIKELRASAEKRLGDKFDVRDFHEVFLRTGRVPMTVLEGAINAYVSQTLSQ